MTDFKKSAKNSGFFWPAENVLVGHIDASVIVGEALDKFCNVLQVEFSFDLSDYFVSSDKQHKKYAGKSGLAISSSPDDDMFLFGEYFVGIPRSLESVLISAIKDIGDHEEETEMAAKLADDLVAIAQKIRKKWR